jgi:hypothetical protein
MTWSEKQQLPSPDGPSAGVTFDAPAPASGYRIYVIGSDLTASAGAVLAYNPSAPSPAWSPVASLIGGVYNDVGATVGPGGLHVTGGYTVGSGPDPTVAVATHQIYDAAANTWILSTPLLAPRSGHVAVTGRDGTIYAIGGRDNNDNILASVEALHPSANQWTNVASMNIAREALAAVTGPYGKIYAIGGETATDTLTDTVEVYDPAAEFVGHRAVWAAVAPVRQGGYGCRRRPRRSDLRRGRRRFRPHHIPDFVQLRPGDCWRNVGQEREYADAAS